MFKEYTLAAYGCVKNTERSTKAATAGYVALLTLLHSALCYAPTLFLTLFPQFLREDGSVSAKGLYRIVVCVFVSLLLLQLASCGYKNYALQISRSSHASYQDTLAPFRRPLRFLLAGLLILLFAGVTVFLAIVGAAFSVLLVAVVIFAAGLVFYLYRPVWFVLFDRPELSVFACFREARMLCRGSRKELFSFDLYFFWFYFLASVLPYFLFSLPVLFPNLLEGMPYTAQEAVAFALGELFSAIIYIWKFDYIATAYACFYNALCSKAN